FGAAALLSASFDAGCSPDRVLQPDSDGEVALTTPQGLENTVAGLGAPVPISFDTYERSRQVVHPSAVEFPTPWHGQRFWLALTPYPNSDSRVENPSLFTSATGDDWTVPTGVTNPVAKSGRGYLSDPELAYDPTSDELRLYYREVIETRHGHQKPKHRADVLYLTQRGHGGIAVAARIPPLAPRRAIRAATPCLLGSRRRVSARLRLHGQQSLSRDEHRRRAMDDLLIAATRPRCVAAVLGERVSVDLCVRPGRRVADDL